MLKAPPGLFAPDRRPPVFGFARAGAACEYRPGAYALLLHDGLLALVREGARYFLPGGGVEPGETLGAALQREVREECGFDCAAAELLGEAIEFVHVPSERRCFRKHGYFFAASALAPPDAFEGSRASVDWVPAQLAVDLLAPRSHAWAVQVYRRQALRARA